MQNHRHAVLLRQGPNVEGAGNGAGNGSSVVGVVQSLAAVKLRTARRELNDDGRIVLPGGFEARVDA
jgi:hypothetical protein